MTNTTCCQSGCLFLHTPIFPPSITLSLLGLKSSRGYISESLPALFSACTSSEVNTFYFYFASGKNKTNNGDDSAAVIPRCRSPLLRLFAFCPVTDSSRPQLLENCRSTLLGLPSWSDIPGKRDAK